MKNLIVILCASFLAGCGAADRAGATLSGHAKTCIDGVLYYQFTSGATVAYQQSGQIKTCEK
jgi:hypothetical protein